MSDKTQNYHLTLPDWEEHVDIEVLNDNFSALDKVVKENEEKQGKALEDSTAELRQVITTGLTKKADLVDGKVPEGQLPAMNYDPTGSAAQVQASLNSHTSNGTVHITSAERTKWDGAVSTASTAQTNLTSHTGNNTVHITAAERTKWNNADSTASTATTNLKSHTDSTTVHLTAAERTKWNNADTNATSAKSAASTAQTTANAALARTGGTMTGTLVTAATAVGTDGARNIRASTTDLTAGTSSLTTGYIYLVYE